MEYDCWSTKYGVGKLQLASQLQDSKIMKI
jgi:hypothetical protein